MGKGKGGLITIGVLLLICVAFPISAIVIIPFIIISLLIGFAIKPFQPKDHGPDIHYAADTIADAIDNSDWQPLQRTLTPQEVAARRPIPAPSVVEEKPEKVVVLKPKKTGEYFNKSKRSVMMDD
jgi:hypothetical protein